MSRSGDRSYSWRGEGRDREIAPTAIRDGEYVAIGRSLLQRAVGNQRSAIRKNGSRRSAV